MKGGKNNTYVIWMLYHYKGTFVWVPATSMKDLVLIQLGEAVHNLPNSLHVLGTKLMMVMWGRLLLF